MHSDPLLTQAELDFIQQLNTPTSPRQQPGTQRQLVIGDQLAELLKRLQRDEQVSIDTHSDNQHLSFPLHLVQDGHSHSRLELGTPLILEQGEIERPWRLVLDAPLLLLDQYERRCGLQVLQISSNGMQVQCSRSSSPGKDLRLQLLLPHHQRVQLHVQLIRRLSQTRYAYSLLPLGEQDEQYLRQFLFEQHNARQSESAFVS